MASAAALFSVRICATARSITSSRRAAELDRGADDARAERLGENQAIAWLRAGVGENAFRIDRAGHRVAEFDLAILHRVSAKQRDAGFAQLVEAAAKDLRDVVGVQAVLRKRRNRQRGERAAAHRIDVAQRVRRGDLSIDIRVVDDRREEVHRLHQRRTTLPRVHTGIVRSPVVDEDAWVSLGWYAAQDLSELARGEFARSTGAADHLGQPAPLLLCRHVSWLERPKSASTPSGIRRAVEVRFRS